VNRRMNTAAKCALLVVSTVSTAHVSAQDHWDGVGGQRWHGRDFDHARGPASLGARLYDARGTLIGDVLYVRGIDYSGGVVLNIKGVFVFAGFSFAGGYQINEPLNNSELVWQYPQLIYSDAHCTGTPYIYYEGGPYRPSAIERKGNTATLYIAKDTISQNVPLTGSSIGAYGTCYSLTPVWVSKGWPVESTVDLTQLYPEPLRIGR
jgi:hypothetical protein